MISYSFIDYRQRSNLATTAAGERRIRKFIESKESELKHLKNQIEKEEAQIISCDNAIYNLELAIPDGTKLLKAHDQNLSILKTLRERISDIPSLLSWETKPEEMSEELCAELKECLAMPAANNGEVIQDQLKLITTEVRRLCDKICQLEMDLEMWKFSRKLSQSSLDHLKSARNTIEEDIILAKSPFSAIWKIPTNVWAMIFDCVRREEMHNYVKTTDLRTIRPIVHVLSHVCHSWRRIVDTEPLLWTTVYAPPTPAWKFHEHDLLVSSTQRSNRHLTLLVNVHQTFTSDFQYDPSRRFEQDGSIAATLVPDEGEIFHGKPYTLHVKMAHDHPSIMQRMTHVPFRQASSVILQARHEHLLWVHLELYIIPGSQVTHNH